MLIALSGTLAFAARAKLETLLLVIAILLTVNRYIRLVTSEFAVTNKRLLIKIGLVQRHTPELLLGKVETIGVEQEIYGRIFNYTPSL